MSASAKLQVVIKDACVLFDLMDLGLLEHFYRLRLIVITTPEVLAEITGDEQLRQLQPYLESGQLGVDRFGVFERMLSIVEANPGLSVTDASVLEAATRRDADILSSDKSLRNESNRQGIKVRGLLWVLEELLLHELLSREVVLEKLALYPEVNRRAPKTEIAQLADRLRQGALENNEEI